MYSFNEIPLSDQLERRLIQEEISRQMFAPAVNFKRIARRIASLFGHTRIDTAVEQPRPAH